MSLVKLSIQGISYSQTQSGAYALILNEVEGERKLPIIIGAFEAQAIAIALENEIKPPRPLTHDLFKTLSDRYNINIKQVIIHKLVDGIFYSSMICERDNIEEIIDARTSDAIALALRFNAPIFTYKNILDKAGVYLSTKENEQENEEKQEDHPEKETTTSQKDQNPYTKYSLTELNELMNNAVQDEDYEKAAQIRDEISKREP